MSVTPSMLNNHTSGSFGVLYIIEEKIKLNYILYRLHLYTLRVSEKKLTYLILIIKQYIFNINLM